MQMKTTKIIQKEMDSVRQQINELEKYEDKKSISARKRLRKKLPELKQYFLYLETNPTKEFCEKEVERLSDRINEISKLYIPPKETAIFTKKQLSTMKTAFEKQWDLPKVRKQLMAVSYILK